MISNTRQPVAGGCLCGAVRYEVHGPLRDVVNCHCTMCQRLHGAFGAHSKARKDQITLTISDGLSWYKTSSIAERGFCNRCGSSLFWRPFEQDSTGILAGSLDDSSKLNTMGHIFVAEKAGFVQITDNLPRFDASSNGELAGDTKK